MYTVSISTIENYWIQQTCFLNILDTKRRLKDFPWFFFCNFLEIIATFNPFKSIWTKQNKNGMFCHFNTCFLSTNRMHIHFQTGGVVNRADLYLSLESFAEKKTLSLLHTYILKTPCILSCSAHCLFYQWGDYYKSPVNFRFKTCSSKTEERFGYHFSIQMNACRSKKYVSGPTFIPPN